MKLKNTDLRVGNYIKSGIIGKVLSIGNDEQEFEQVYCECEESFEWFFKGNYEGIKLSKDLLIKLGGIENGFKNIEFDISTFDNQYKKIVVSNNLDYIFLREGSSEKRIEDDLVVLVNLDMREDFYIHSFQNLYFILTGKELEGSLLSTD